jgi:hypothetical protein
LLLKGLETGLVGCGGCRGGPVSVALRAELEQIKETAKQQGEKLKQEEAKMKEQQDVARQQLDAMKQA